MCDSMLALDQLLGTWFRNGWKMIHEKVISGKESIKQLISKK